jgi:DNA-binding FadR family transcriptional regulator
MRDPERRARSIEERKVILRAILNRDAKAAELAAQEHLRRAREYRIERSLSEDILA